MERRAVNGVLNSALFAISLFALSASSAVINEKVCYGTHQGFTEPNNYEAHLLDMKGRYAGCTFVRGNLELTWLREEHLDLSFLRDIREITGYALLFNVGVQRIPLPNLQIIRGEKLLKTSHRAGFAFFASTVTSESIEMPNLREIRKGSVGFIKCTNLCQIKTIDWDKITNRHAFNVFDIADGEMGCSPCDASCTGGCWGTGRENCQRFNSENCHLECPGRCFGEGYEKCCHPYCAVGCHGPQSSDCISCRHFSDDGTCVLHCPKGKYQYGASCVRSCPAPTMKDNDACVTACPPNKRAMNGECVSCVGPCQKVCSAVDFIHSGNVERFRNCTTIDGSLVIKDISFTGYQTFHSNFVPGPNYPEMHPEMLEIFSTLKEITGFLSVKASHPSFKDLSYFRSLDTIRGETLSDNQVSLIIENTSLKTLGLRSLKTIMKGTLVIRGNKELCMLDKTPWNSIKKSSSHSIRIQDNRPESDCTADGYKCHQECSSQGCWGTEANGCFSCKNYKLKDFCIGPCRNSTVLTGETLQEDDTCFTNAFLPGLSLYRLDETSKELVDGHVWDDLSTHVYVTTNKQYQFWVQHLKQDKPPSGSNEDDDSQSCPNKQIEWVDEKNGTIPEGGFLGGTDPKCMLYVGRTHHKGELLPGKVCPRYNSIYVAWKGEEHLYNNYQILIGSNFEWAVGSGKKIPPCAVPGGQLEDGTTVYIGRTSNAGALDIGRVNPSDGLLYIPYYGKEYSFRAYEILVFKSKQTIQKELHDKQSKKCSGRQSHWKDVEPGHISTENLVSGNDSKCMYYVGRTPHDGDLIPGKVCTEQGALYISWGGEEFTYKPYQMLSGQNFEWVPVKVGIIPDCAVEGGHTVDGTPLYIGRVLHNGCLEIGKVNPVDGLLYLAYYKKEYTFTEYDILVFKNH